MKKRKVRGFLLVLTLVVGMVVPALAASPVRSGSYCKKCGNSFDFWVGPLQDFKSYTEYFNVREIDGLAEDNDKYFESKGVYCVMMNGTNDSDLICFDCLTTIVNEYKTANAETTVSGITTVDDTTGAADIPITVVRDAPTFSVTVPTSMPIFVGADGKVTTAEDIAIENNGSQAVCVKSIAINATADWSLAKYDKTAMQAEAVDSKKIGFLMTIGSQTAATTIDGKSETIGSYATLDITISPSSRQAISYDGVIPAQSIGISSDTQVANVVFTFDWAA